MTRVNVTVDGVLCSDDVEPRTLLVQYLRDTVGKVGTVIGCDTSNCGACTVHLDGRSVKSCNVLAVQADGHEVTTIEGIAASGELHPMQQAFHDNHALQCGYCTPGMIMQALDVLKENPNPTEQEIRVGLEGNLCRCTGYHNIVKAVAACASTMAEGGGAVEDDSRCTVRERGVMTAVDDRPTTEIGAARKRKEDRRLITGRTKWTDNIQLPGHAAPRHGAQPVRPREHHRDRHRRRPRPLRGRRRSSPAVTSPRAWASWRTPGRSTTSRRPPTTCPIAVRPRGLRRRDRRGRRRAQRRSRPGCRRAGRRRLRRAAGGARRPRGPQGRGAGAPGPGHQQVGVLAARLGRRGHRR